MRTFTALVSVIVIPLLSFADDAPQQDRKPPEPLQHSIDSALIKASPCVVSLWYGKPMRHVTGTIVTPDGLIVTCAHLDR